MLKDEHQALQLAFTSLEKKLRETQVYMSYKIFFLFSSKNFYCKLLKEIG